MIQAFLSNQGLRTSWSGHREPMTSSEGMSISKGQKPRESTTHCNMYDAGMWSKKKKAAFIKLDACGETVNCNLAQTNARFHLSMPYLFR
jgi:hypothetical protein